MAAQLLRSEISCIGWSARADWAALRICWSTIAGRVEFRPSSPGCEKHQQHSTPSLCDTLSRRRTITLSGAMSMQHDRLLAAAIVAGLLFSAQPAMAFTVDDKSGNYADGTARYVDTDEKQPSSAFRFGVQGQSSSDSVDRNSPSLLSNPAFSGTPLRSPIPDAVYTNPARRR